MNANFPPNTGYSPGKLDFHNTELLKFNTIIFTSSEPYPNLEKSIEIDGVLFQFATYNNDRKTHMTGFNQQYICETDIGGLVVGYDRLGS